MQRLANSEQPSHSSLVLTVFVGAHSVRHCHGRRGSKARYQKYTARAFCAKVNILKMFIAEWEKIVSGHLPRCARQADAGATFFERGRSMGALHLCQIAAANGDGGGVMAASTLLTPVEMQSSGLESALNPWAGV